MKNTKNILSPKGYFYHTDEKTKKWYIWEYEKKPAAKGSPENVMVVNLIYSDVKNDLTIPKIVSTFSRWNVDGGTKMPVVEMLSVGDFPINETLLPLFKRKLISYIDQKQLIENYKKKKEELNS